MWRHCNDIPTWMWHHVFLLEWMLRSRFEFDFFFNIERCLCDVIHGGSGDCCDYCALASGHNRTWWRHQMETFSAVLAICAGNSPVPGEFPAQRPVTRSFDVFFDLRLNKRLSKQSWGWWFETPSRSLWCHCNELPRKARACDLCLWKLRIMSIWINIYAVSSFYQVSFWHITVHLNLVQCVIMILVV